MRAAVHFGVVRVIDSAEAGKRRDLPRCWSTLMVSECPAELGVTR